MVTVMMNLVWCEGSTDQKKNILVLCHSLSGHVRPNVELVQELSQSSTVANITILNAKMSLLADSRMNRWYYKQNVSENDNKVHVSLMNGDIFFNQVATFEDFHREMEKMIEMELEDQFMFTFTKMLMPYEKLMLENLEIVEINQVNGEIENVVTFEDRLQQLSKIPGKGIKRYLRIRNDPSQTLFDQAVVDYSMFVIQSIIAGSKLPCSKIVLGFFRQFSLHYPSVTTNSLDDFTKYPNRFLIPFNNIKDMLNGQVVIETFGKYFEMDEMFLGDSQCALIQTSSYAFEFASMNTQYFNAHLVGPFINEKQIESEIALLRKMSSPESLNNNGFSGLFDWIDEQEDIMLLILGSTMVLDSDGMKKLMEGLHITLKENPKISILVALGNVNMNLFEEQSKQDITQKTIQSLKINKRFKILQSFVPQKGLLSLEKIKLFFTHCGANSVNEALYFGKLLIGFPFAYDQMRVSHAIEEFKVGRSIYKSKKASKDWNIENISKAVHELLYDDKTRELYKTKSRHTRSLMRRSGGVKRAAEIVELVSEVDGDLSWGVADKHLSWWQFYCLDILVVYAGIIYIFGKVSCLICCRSKVKTE